MENEQIDVQEVEETTASPSEETQPAETSEEVNKVPYDRFKEVVEERNKYKELLSIKDTSDTKIDTSQATGENYEEALKIVQSEAKKVVSSEIDSLKRQIDLDRTSAKYNDFFQYSDAIKQKIQDNPRLSWEDAYKLSKYDAVAVQAKEQGKQEAYKKIEQKKAATVETASKSKTSVGGSDVIDPLAKGPDGKYLYSLKELKDILPNK